MKYLGLLIGLWACSPLPELIPEQCGNGVVEAGEACDLFIPRRFQDRPLRCGAPDTGAQACSLICDPVQGGQDCPSGWQCGADQICRYADWSQSEVLSENSVVAPGFGVADFDGDGLLDVHAGGADTLELLYGNGAGGFGARATQRTALRRGPVVAADVDADGRADLLVPIQSGVDVLLGQASRELAPQLYTRPALDNNPLDLRVLLPEVGSPCYGARPLFLALLPGSLPNQTNAYLVFSDGALQPVVYPLEQPIQSLLSLRGAIPHGDLDGDGRADVLFALPGAGRALVTRVELANAAASPSCRQARYRVSDPTVIPLGGAALVGPAQLVDVDGDGQRDALFGTDQGARVALGPLPATLNWSPIADNRPLADRDCNPAPDGIQRVVLAAGDLDEEAGADLVTPEGIFAGRSNRLLPGGLDGRLCQLYPASSAWDEAVVGDFNGDQRLDVAVLDLRNETVSVLLNAGEGRFNEFPFPGLARPQFLRAGDFDGDGTDDLVFVEEDNQGSSLRVVYGGSALGVAEPFDMGRLPVIRSVEPGYLGLGGVIETDARTDLAVGASTSRASSQVDAFALVQGMASRRMFAPLVTVDGADSRVDPVALAAGHFLGEDGTLDLAVVGPNLDNSSGRIFGALPGTGAALSASDFLFEQGAGGCGGPVDEGARSCVLTAAGPLDPGSTLDTMVVVEGASDCADPSGEPQLCLFTPGASGAARSCSLPQRLSDAGQALTPQALQGVSLADLDQDGDLDLVLAFAGRGLPGSPGGLAILQRDPEGPCGYGASSVVTVPLGRVVQSAVALNADDDPALEVALLVDRDVYLVDGFPAAPVLSNAPIFSLGGGRPTALRAADLDQDGVDELLIGSADGLVVRRARPVTTPRAEAEEVSP